MPTIEFLERHIGNLETENRRLRESVADMEARLGEALRNMDEMARIIDMPGFQANIGRVERLIGQIEMLSGIDGDKFFEWAEKYVERNKIDSEDADLSEDELMAKYGVPNVRKSPIVWRPT